MTKGFKPSKKKTKTEEGKKKLAAQTEALLASAAFSHSV
jgi:hypothetical protein